MYELYAQKYSAHVFFLCDSECLRCKYNFSPNSDCTYVTKRCSSGLLTVMQSCIPISAYANMSLSLSSKWPLYCVNGVCHNFSCTLVSLATFSAGEISIEFIYHHLLIRPKITVPSFWSTILSTSIFFHAFCVCVPKNTHRLSIFHCINMIISFNKKSFVWFSMIMRINKWLRIYW